MRMSEKLCQFLPWDSEFFGYRIGRILAPKLDDRSIHEALQWANANSIDCLYFLSDSQDARTVRLVEQNRFQLRDIRVTLTHNLLTIAPAENNSEVHFRLSEPDDFTKLQDTALHAYIHSRFYYDPCFTEDQCARLYARWLEKSILEDFADAVIIAETKTEPLGYVSCHLNHQTTQGQIGLVGVTESARGQQIGKKMINYVLQWFQLQGMETVNVVTQGRNIPAQRLYQRCGFVTQDVQLWYHKWFIDCKKF